jgi:hypothetical protein
LCITLCKTCITLCKNLLALSSTHFFINRLSKVHFYSLAATCDWLKWVSTAHYTTKSNRSLL